MEICVVLRRQQYGTVLFQSTQEHLYERAYRSGDRFRCGRSQYDCREGCGTSRSWQRGGRRDSFEEGDQVWAVFDRDDHPHFKQAVELCESNGIYVGRSNPCFELWLVLHERDHNRYETRHRMQSILGDLRPEYDRRRGKTPDCEEMISRVEAAEQRAEQLLLRRQEEGNPYGNPSTTVGRLTRAVRTADSRAQARP